MPVGERMSVMWSLSYPIYTHTHTHTHRHTQKKHTHGSTNLAMSLDFRNVSK